MYSVHIRNNRQWVQKNSKWWNKSNLVIKSETVTGIELGRQYIKHNFQKYIQTKN